MSGRGGVQAVKPYGPVWSPNICLLSCPTKLFCIFFVSKQLIQLVNMHKEVFVFIAQLQNWCLYKLPVPFAWRWADATIDKWTMSTLRVSVASDPLVLKIAWLRNMAHLVIDHCRLFETNGGQFDVRIIYYLEKSRDRSTYLVRRNK